LAILSPFVLSLVFFFICLRPPTPTLFPYTTLFRSRRRRGRPRAGACGPAPRRPRVPGEPRRARAAAGRPALHHLGVSRAGPRRGDRKSTRLNSSHVKISYAVFCLKKKKESYCYCST